MFCSVRILILLFIVSLASFGQDRELIIRQGHRDAVNMVKYSIDGKHVFTAGEDGLIKMWDTSNGIDVKTFTGHNSGVKCIELNPDGQFMLSGDAEGNVMLWNLEGDPIPIKQYKAHEKAINVIKIMPDQSGFLTGSSDKLIKHWDMSDFALIKTIEGMTGAVKSFGISPDGKRMVMGAQRSNDVELLLIDLEKGVIIDDALKHIKGSGAAKAYTAVLLTPFALASNIGKGDIDKDVATYYVFSYRNIEFLEDGKSVLLSQNLYLPLMQAKSDEEKTGGTSVSFLELNEDRSKFQNVTSAKKWNIDYPRSRAIFNEDQTKIIINIKNSIKVYDVANADFPTTNKEAQLYKPPLLKEFTGNISWLTSIAISPDYRTVVSSSEDGKLDLWDINSERRIRPLEGYVQPVLAVEPMPDGRHIIVGSKNKRMAMWDITTGHLVRSFDRSYDVNHIDVSKDGRYMVTTAVNTKFFKLWSISSGNIIGTFMEKNENIIWVKFDDDPDYILAATESGELKKWSKSEKKIKKKLNESYMDFDKRHENGSISITLDGRNLLVTDNGNSLINDRQRGYVTDAVFTIDGKKVITTNDLGETSIYNLESGKLIVNMALIDDFDFITYTPEFYYTSSKNASKALAFKEKDRILSFEQMELRFNRPDLVAKKLGYASEKLITSYQSAYLSRLKRLGYTEDDISGNLMLPIIKVNDEDYPLATTEKEFVYDVTCNDFEANLDKINVFINDVPVFGNQGIDISEDGNSTSKEIKVNLSSGLNEIKTVVANENGMESIPHKMEINYEASYRKPELYLLSIGVSNYKNAKYNLAFAAKDATDVYNFFTKSEVFAKVNAKVLVNADANSDNLSQIGSFLAQADIDDVVIIFIAGHGVLDNNYRYYFATYDMDFLDPANGGMSYEMLESALMNSKCRNKLLFMDTCHSGEVDTDEVELVKTSVKKSGRVAFRSNSDIVRYKENAFGLGNTLELSKSLFGDLKKGTGATVISAAGGVEYAREGMNSKNGLFTSCLLEGLSTRRADLNRDRQYTVSEFKQYISRRVVELSRGQQVLTTREENLKNDFRIY
jgi:WD40 repeat protein